MHWREDARHHAQTPRRGDFLPRAPRALHLPNCLLEHPPEIRVLAPPALPLPFLPLAVITLALGTRTGVGVVTTRNVTIILRIFFTIVVERGIILRSNNFVRAGIRA
jgi:hypothetical protein